MGRSNSIARLRLCSDPKRWLHNQSHTESNSFYPPFLEIACLLARDSGLKTQSPLLRRFILSYSTVGSLPHQVFHTQHVLVEFKAPARFVRISRSYSIPMRPVEATPPWQQSAWAS